MDICRYNKIIVISMEFTEDTLSDKVTASIRNIQLVEWLVTLFIPLSGW